MDHFSYLEDVFTDMFHLLHDASFSSFNGELVTPTAASDWYIADHQRRAPASVPAAARTFPRASLQLLALRRIGTLLTCIFTPEACGSFLVAPLAASV